MTTEKRNVPRLTPFVAPCRVTAGGRRFSAFVADLSPQGARVTCDHECLDVGEEVHVEVKLARRAVYLTVHGSVVWVRTGDKGEATFGVRFGDMPPEDRQALEGVVQDFQRLAARLS